MAHLHDAEHDFELGTVTPDRRSPLGQARANDEVELVDS